MNVIGVSLINVSMSLLFELISLKNWKMYIDLSKFLTQKKADIKKKENGKLHAHNLDAFISTYKDRSFG